MSDTGDDWAAYKEQQKQERAKRRDSAEQRLKNAGLQFTVHNGGAHIVITEGGAVFDYWPGTERWRMRDFKGQFGFDNLLAAIRQRKVLAMDLGKIEERVVAMMPAHAAPYGRRYNPNGPFGDIGAIFKTTGANYPGTTTGRMTSSTPPWQDPPHTLDDTKAYVENMEKAYPHLKGEDE